MLLFKVGIGAVFDSASGPLWSFGGASEMRVKSLRIRIDIVTVLCVFKVHFACVFSFLLVSRIYSHVFPARHCAPPLPRAAYDPARPPGTKPQQP